MKLKKFTNFIDETFNHPYRWMMDSEEDTKKVYYFRTSDNRAVRVFFQTDEPGDTSWEVSFTVNGKTEVTAGGDAFKIFGTVIDIVKDFMQEFEPTSLMLSADTKGGANSRASLYAKMVKNLAGSDYTVTEQPKKDFVIFKMTRKNRFQKDVEKAEK